ncbi:glycoside hydrolase family 6 protein [Gryllotalpicola reticulitermitis]|uniref:Glucanase n=1 Tax=Gryllotalpicola reticulitermitis TaxID=1184153 RepID=A0ABV8Q749_9MICO
MIIRTPRAAVALGAGLAAAALVVALSSPAMAATPHTPPAPHGPVAPQKTSHVLGQAKLFVAAPSSDAVKQTIQLAAHHDTTDAIALAKVLATPQAVWLDGGTPAQVRKTVQRTIAAATVERTVPVFVAYNIPGRDCDQYSAGGATDTASYEAWIAAIAAGIGNAKAGILVEPDSLGLIPSDCIATHGLTTAEYPFTDADRYAQLNYAVQTLEAKPNTSVYLDATHPAWENVGDISSRLISGGVNNAQGFFVNVSNYQYTVNDVDYGTWISDCIALVNAGETTAANCYNQYWNGGPNTGWNGVALDDYSPWQSTDPSQLSTYAGDITLKYDNDLASAGVTPTAHFVVDTSRNGTGPNDMSAYAAAPYDQSTATISALVSGNWCNPPGAGLGLTPTTRTGNPLVDAYLWVKTPGESDGQCDSAGGARAWDYGAYTQPGWPTDASSQALFDPLWGQVDPAAGAWFPAQMLDLIRHANPAL